jgi:putative tryptophan/tyrosine transport system substrate-binding protein
MRRRNFIKGIVGVATAWPFHGLAQQSAMPVVGFLESGSPEAIMPLVAAFRQGLQETGYTEGQNVLIEYRWAEGQYDQMPALAADLVGRKVAVIAATGVAAGLATKAATTTIPIVFVMGDDPVKFGLVVSLNRPGGNVTGVSFLTPSLEAKRVELLHELVPKATMFAVLVNPKFPGADIRVTAVRSAASALGLQLSVLNASSEGEIDSAFATLVQRQAGALLVASDPFFFSRREQLIVLAERHSVPTLHVSREFVTAGALISYGANASDAHRHAGIYTGKILKGAKPGDLPVVQPTKFELVINLKTAGALGLGVPDKLIALADEVIE